jgi:short-subunit dehydrogenase
MNKYTLITGATFGIGYEFAKLFASEGFNLILVARNKNRLSAISKELFEKYKIDVQTIEKDLSHLNSAEEVFEEVNKKNLEVEILVNNAGFGNHGKFWETDLKTELEMIQLNITSLIQITKLFLPKMIENKHGRILNVASTAAFQPGPFMNIYYATKAFVLSFSEALNSELKGTGVTSTVLCPGPTKTEFFARAGMEDTVLVKTKIISKMPAEKAAKIGYKGLMKGKRIVIPGIPNRIGVLFVKLFPRKLIISVVRLLKSQKQAKCV